jgi:2-polyprenyl-6-methoxyphenol hydroxylase-like FAD-dependent oxidoreductase
MHYDLIVAGGGVAGAALAFRMARSGARVLVAERELTFRDRVRGESIHPWGVVEALRLGLGETLSGSSFRQVPSWQLHVGGAQVLDRDLTQSLAGQPLVHVHHPELQQALLDAAAAAGAELRRGARVAGVSRGRPARVTLDQGQSQRSLSARLVVAADGRDSPLRRAAGVSASGELSELLTAGVLIDGHRGPVAAQSLFYPPAFCELALCVPLPKERARIYFVQRRDAAGERLSGEGKLPQILAACRALGMPAAWLESAEAAGPLATFETRLAECSSVALAGGLVFIGDAAGTVDPIYGCGLALALMDARSLAERLLETPDWDAAAARHAEDRRIYATSLRTLERWLTRLYYTPGDAAAELRLRASPRLAALGIDLVVRGPASPTDAQTEAALFA